MSTPGPTELSLLIEVATRLDQLADTAELMGDDAGAARMRADAVSRRMRAMSLLDDATG